MKRFLFSLLVLGVLLIGGCTNIPKYQYDYSYTVVKDNKNYNVDVVNYNERGVLVSVKNNTDDVIEIDWNGSNISGSNIFMGGQKYIDAGKPIPSTVIAPQGTVQKELYRADSVSYSSYGWSVGYMGYPVELILKVIVNGKAEFEVIRLNREVIMLDSVKN